MNYRSPVRALLALIALGCGSELTETPRHLVASVIITPYARSLSVGDTVRLVVGLRDEKGNWIGSSQPVSWSTSDPTVASVSSLGTVTALTPGSARITATCEGVSGTADIVVPPPPVPEGPRNFVGTGAMITPRVGHTATLLDDGTVLIAGGSDELPRSAEIYDPVTGRFSRTGDTVDERNWSTATRLADGRVLIIGGHTGGWTGITNAEIYDPLTRTFSATGPMLEPPSFITATLLPDGTVLMAGGLTEPCYPCRVQRAELYNPATEQFTLTGSYAQSGTAAIPGGPAVANATLLQNGQVLLAASPRGEIYDPPTGTFRQVGSMVHLADIFYDRPAALLPSGKVLFVAGVDDWSRYRDAELFDPASVAFSPAGSLSMERAGHTVTPLIDGRVLITGGETLECNQPNCGIFSTPTAELFDPVAGRFTLAGRMRTERQLHTATRLRDGRVLIAGGVTYHGGLGHQVTSAILSSAELYIPPANTSTSHPH